MPCSVRYDKSQMVSMSSDARERQFPYGESAEPLNYSAAQVR